MPISKNMFKNILLHIISNNKDFCALCLEIKKDFLNFRDNLYDEIDSYGIDLSTIIIAVFGEDMLNDGLLDFSICSDCAKSLLKSYLLIESCKKNFEYLKKSVALIEDMFKHTSVSCQTLVVNIDPELKTCKKIYDYKKYKNSLNVLNQFTDFVNTQSLGRDSKMFSEPLEVNSKVKLKGKVNERKKKVLNKQFRFDEVFQKLICKHCRKLFHSVNEANDHFGQFHLKKCLEQHKKGNYYKFVCSHCGKLYKNEHTLRIHEQGHFLRIVCPSCGRLYKNRDTYKNHIDLKICEQVSRKVPSQGPYTCDICQKRYSQKQTLQVHIKFEHGDGKTHDCKWCEKRFNCLSKLNAHIVKHTQEKRYSCEICKGKFVSKESLLYHSRIHTGEKPYKCLYCDQRFLSSSRRTDHTKRHHIGAKIECEHCKTKFFTRFELRKHKCERSTDDQSVESHKS